LVRPPRRSAQLRAALRPIVGLLLTALFLVLAFQRVDLSAFADELRRVNYIWLIPSAMCTLAGYLLRTVRRRRYVPCFPC
jgi:uncharacterized membrane protein YbhN (UPF0104 family)